MKSLSDHSLRTIHNEVGAATIEHGLMIALLAAICMVFIAGIGAGLGRILGTASSNVSNAGHP